MIVKLKKKKISNKKRLKGGEKRFWFIYETSELKRNKI